MYDSGSVASSKIKLCTSYFVFNDDNRPFYQIDPLSAPTPQLGADCSITHFIAPLYHKIYLDAQKAIEYTRILCNNFLDLPDNVTLRTFLAPNRTYQSYIINDSKLSEIHKSLLLNRLHFPKFIWVTEIATYDNFCSGTDAIILRSTYFRPIQATACPPALDDIATIRGIPLSM